MSGQSDGQTPRSSTSSRPSASSPSNLNGHTHTPEDGTLLSGAQHVQSDGPEILSHNLEESSDPELARKHDSPRTRQRRSGGFLLTSRPPLKLPKTATSKKDQTDVKGKEKDDDAGLVVPKRRSLLQRHRLKPSIGSSPLAKEVLNVASGPGTDQGETSDGGETLSVPSRTSQSIRSSAGSGLTQDRRPSGDVSKSRDATPALGFDTDATQLVNLALSLSESRRRNFSGGLLTPVNAIGERRTPSAGLTGTGFATTNGGGSLQHHLQQQRRISRNLSPRTDRSGNRGTPSPRALPTANTPIQSPTLPDIDLNGRPDAIFSPSDATLSRAEKARIALELGYEYRRLLQYLPKIPTDSKGRHATARTLRKDAESHHDLGRPYNPLQYVRNRKVRLRERRPLDVEAEGWKDVVSVRNWIDIVAAEREAGIATVDDRYPLPSFEVLSAQPSAVDSSNALDGANIQTKPRRPRQDWTFAPWDLLADVYWLQHDGNITHIEDRSGHKILSSPESYKVPSTRPSAELDRASHKRSESINRQAISPEKYRSLVDRARKEASRERGHQHTEQMEPHTPTRHPEGPRDRKSRWPRKFVRSKSSSSLSDSDGDDLGGHRHHRRKDQEFLDSAVLEKHMRNLLEQELDENGPPASHERTKDVIASVAEHDLAEKPEQNINGDISSSRPGRKDAENAVRSKSIARSVQPSARTSLDDHRGRRPRLSLDEDLDTTAPSSLKAKNFLPSISIDLSRPNSPPATSRKPSPSRKRFRPARSKERQAISETDFAVDTRPLSQQSSHDSRPENITGRDKGHSLMDGFLSPTATEGFNRRFRRSDGPATRGPKESSDSDSKLKGFFKGGRIAEIVGNEVSRVGDRLWRRDASTNASPVASPPSSAGEESDTEDDAMVSSPDANTSHIAARNRRPSEAAPEPKYHLENLPSFRSPFGKDKSNAETTDRSMEQDAKSPQLLEQRGRERSSRFNRLAPPKLDMRNVSPSSSPPLTRTQTRNTVSSYDPFDSRHSSTSRSEVRVQEDDRRLNAVLGVPGTVGRGGPPVTGLATLDSRQFHPSERSSTDGRRQWSIADHDVSKSRGTVTKRDIARVRALLLSSEVKAHEITRRAHEISEARPPMLCEVQHISKQSLPIVPRSKEHNLAARVYASTIDDSHQQLRGAAEKFSNETLDHLHKQIKDIDEKVTQKLTASVRTCADEADAFSAQLTTTYVLEIKQLNDSVDAILRRRRRRLRWIRRGGYVLLEWTLLGIMWWVWLIVVIIRLARGTIRGFFAAVRWLLWL